MVVKKQSTHVETVCGQYSLQNVLVDSYGVAGTNHRVANRFMRVLGNKLGVSWPKLKRAVVR